MNFEKLDEELLRELASKGDIHQIQTLLSNKPNLNVNSQNAMNGWTALHWAAKRNHTQVVEYLLEKGANKDIQANDKLTPAHVCNNESLRKILESNTSDINIPANAKWAQNGGTIAGGNGSGGATNQLYRPFGLFVDDDQTVAIADWGNHRIMQWKNGDTTNGQVVAGGKGQGNGSHQLYWLTDVLIDKETDSLIICDQMNRRVVRWSRRSGTTQGEILIEGIDCYGLAMDEQRYLYVSDIGKHEVRRYQLGEKNGTLIAGGNGKGNDTNQLNYPRYLVVDRQQTVYVSDNYNHRVMKWNKDAKEGIVVAGGQGQGNALTQLYYPEGIFVDTLGTFYVADSLNHRVMRWTQGDKKQGTVIVGGNGSGTGPNQFNGPRDNASYESTVNAILPIIPNYLRHPVFPYISSEPRSNLPNLSANDTQTITLLCRVADDPSETDYVEFEFNKSPIIGSFERLQSNICHELDIDHIDKLRRLPCVRVRNDRDVERLKDNHMLEVILIKQ
ncbi:unnamed protein product [Rotaria socialis]